MLPPPSAPPPSARDVRAAELSAPARLRSPETGAVGRPRLPLEVSRSEAVATLRSVGRGGQMDGSFARFSAGANAEFGFESLPNSRGEGNRLGNNYGPPGGGGRFDDAESERNADADVQWTRNPRAPPRAAGPGPAPGPRSRGPAGPPERREGGAAQMRSRRPRRDDGFTSGDKGGGYGYGRNDGFGDGEAYEGRLQDMGQEFTDMLYGYANDKARVIPTRAKSLSSLASGLFKSDVQRMIETQSPEEKEMNDFVDTLQHWHFEPANPFKVVGEYQSCQVDRLLSHHEEFAHILDTPPDALVTRDAWLGALELPEDSPMRRNVRFLRVLDELSQPKYTAQNKQQFVDGLRYCMMLDPKKAGYPEGGGLPEPPAWSDVTPRFIYGSSVEATREDYVRRFPHLRPAE